jgi:hypothetical protein
MKTKKRPDMKMPGFTAEVTLYEKSASYRMLRTDIQTGGTVVPAFWRCWGNVCCDEWGNCFSKGPRLM